MSNSHDHKTMHMKHEMKARWAISVIWGWGYLCSEKPSDSDPSEYSPIRKTESLCLHAMLACRFVLDSTPAVPEGRGSSVMTRSA